MKKYLGLITIVAFAALALVGCKKEEPKKNGGSTIVQVKTVKIDPETKTLKVGDSFEFTVTVDPATVSHEVSVDNAEIVKVEGNKATALAEGKAVITATAGGKTATLTVTVTKDGNAEVDQSRIIGAIYFPPVEQFSNGKMASHKDVIMQAMANVLGYEYNPFSDDPEGKIAYRFLKKKDDKDKQKIFPIVSYYHTPSKGAIFMDCVTFLEANSFTADSGEQILAAYGFTTDVQKGKLETGEVAAQGINSALGLQAIIFGSTKKDSNGEYDFVDFQIGLPSSPQMLQKPFSVEFSEIIK